MRTSLTILMEGFHSGGSRGGSGGSLEPPFPLAVFKYSMKMKYFGLSESETKLFYIHGIFKKNEIRSALYI